MQTKQNKQNKQTQAQVQTTLEECIVQKLEKLKAQDPKVMIYPVTGYVTVKYGNKVLMEFHPKKRSISHITFSQKQKVFEFLKNKKLIHRVVPPTYGWKYDTECLLSSELVDCFDEILKNIMDEVVSQTAKTVETVKEKAKA